MDLIYELMSLAAICALCFVLISALADHVNGEPSDDRDDY